MKRSNHIAVGFGRGSMAAHDAMIDETERCGVSLAFVQRAWALGLSVEQLLNRITADWGV